MIPIYVFYYSSFTVSQLSLRSHPHGIHPTHRRLYTTHIHVSTYSPFPYLNHSPSLSRTTCNRDVTHRTHTHTHYPNPLHHHISLTLLLLLLLLHLAAHISLDCYLHSPSPSLSSSPNIFTLILQLMHTSHHISLDSSFSLFVSRQNRLRPYHSQLHQRIQECLDTKCNNVYESHSRKQIKCTYW